MPDFKISLITVTYNAERTISHCIESIIQQNFKDIEYIIIDGGSTDDTLKIIDQYKEHINLLVSEPDKGIYDAMNKGIKLATGDVVGMLNADDFFSNENILSLVASSFKNQDVQITYGDLDYINSSGDIIRKWHSGKYKHGMFNWGWMPPHPTFYCKRNLFDQFGYYRLDYGTAADYELMLRFIHYNHIDAHYVEQVMIKMEIGGASNKSYRNRVKGLLFDFKAMRNNSVLIPAIALLFKPLRKISQYF